jgi:hypothetical protein
MILRVRRALAAAMMLLATSSALADGELRLDVELGKTVERDVAYARGWFCDDPSLVHADLVTRGDRNVWIVTGAKLGVTLCRVGTNPAVPPSYVFEVRVVPAKKR